MVDLIIINSRAPKLRRCITCITLISDGYVQHTVDNRQTEMLSTKTSLVRSRTFADLLVMYREKASINQKLTIYDDDRLGLVTMAITL